MADWSYIVGDTDEVIDEKGNTALMLRDMQWKHDGKEGTMRLELRRFIMSAEGEERANKGVAFLTEDGPHNLANTLLRLGYGNTQECIEHLAKREDFEESLINVIGTGKVEKVKKASPKVKYFDPKELTKIG